MKYIVRPKRTKAQVRKYNLRVNGYALLGYLGALGINHLAGGQVALFLALAVGALWLTIWTDNGQELFTDKHKEQGQEQEQGEQEK